MRVAICDDENMQLSMPKTSLETAYKSLDLVVDTYNSGAKLLNVVDAMLVLVVDRHLYRMVDKEDYIEEMRNQRGLFVWVYNLLADHPVMCKRIVALAEGRGSGKLY